MPSDQQQGYRLPPTLAWVPNHPTLAPLFCGGGDEAWLADIEAGSLRPEPPIKPAQRDLMTAEDHLAELACVAFRRAEEWLACHAVRAEGRHLEVSRDICLRVASIVRSLRQQIEERGVVSTSIGWLVVRLYDCVVEIAEADACACAAGLQHLREIQASGLWAGISAIADVGAHARDFREGLLDPLGAVRGATQAVASVWAAPTNHRECLDA